MDLQLAALAVEMNIPVPIVSLLSVLRVFGSALLPANFGLGFSIV